MTTWGVAALAGAGGALALPFFVRTGLRELGRAGRTRSAVVISSAAVGVASAVCAAIAADRAGSWRWLPALLLWATTLSAAAACDALAQRVPTRLVLRAAVAVLALLILASVLTNDWRALAVATVSAASSAAIFLICWRFLGAGFGDVRLAALGGLGLGHATFASLAAGVGFFAVVLTVQAIWTMTVTHDRHATFGYGPALAVGFLVAATA